MTDRQVIVVDVETTGLHDAAAILEVAALNLNTGEEITFVPYVTREQLANAQPEAMRINRYYERGVFRNALNEESTRLMYETLHGQLEGNTFAGSNPTFDSRLISREKYFKKSEYVPFGVKSYAHAFGAPWHHRLLDLSAYAAGALGLPLEELPGLHKVCEILGVKNEEEHSALGDVRATAQCFRRLKAMTMEQCGR